MNNLSGFERSIKETVGNHQPAYDPKSWEQLEQKLKNSGAGANQSWWIGAAAASVITAGSLFYFAHSEQGIAATSLQSDALTFRSSENIRPFVESETIASDETTVQFDDVSQDQIASTDTQAKSNQTPKQSTQASDEDSKLAANTVTNEASPSEESTTVSTPTPKPPKARSSMAAFSVSAIEVCVGEEINFDLLNSEVAGNFLWNFGDGDFDIRETPTHIFNKPGKYDVSLSVTDNLSGSIHNSPVGQPIIVRAKPQAKFATTAVESSIKRSTIQFQNESHKADQCLWLVDGQTSREINPEFEFKGKGKYLVKLYVENDNGCADSIFQYVEIKDEVKLGAASQLSLSSGESFMPESLKAPDVFFRMTIYDQKTPIFESVSSYAGWDGTLANGDPAVIDNKYTWVVTILENGQEKNAFSGSVKIRP